MAYVELPGETIVEARLTNVAFDDIRITNGAWLGIDQLACAPGTVSLDANVGGSGDTYLWSTGATTQSITVTQAGTYGVTVTNAAGCTMASAMVVVTVASAPTPVLTQNNGVFGTTQSYASYQWMLNGNQLPTSIQPPLVNSLDFTGGALMTFAVSHPTMTETELSWFIDDTIARDLQSVRGVGQVSRVGGVNREINITLDPVRMGAIGVTAADINNAVQRSYRNYGGGMTQVGGSEITTRVIGDDANLIRKFPATRGRIFEAAYAPDGKRIATVSSLDRKGQLSIFSSEFDGTMPDDIKAPLPEGGDTRETKLADALSERYLAYALSTIVSRSLPDVRDGLKPVHRRIVGRVGQKAAVAFLEQFKGLFRRDGVAGCSHLLAHPGRPSIRGRE